MLEVVSRFGDDAGDVVVGSLQVGRPLASFDLHFGQKSVEVFCHSQLLLLETRPHALKLSRKKYSILSIQYLILNVS